MVDVAFEAAAIDEAFEGFMLYREGDGATGDSIVQEVGQRVEGSWLVDVEFDGTAAVEDALECIELKGADEDGGSGDGIVCEDGQAVEGPWLVDVAFEGTAIEDAFEDIEADAADGDEDEDAVIDGAFDSIELGADDDGLVMLEDPRSLIDDSEDDAATEDAAGDVELDTANADEEEDT